MIRGVKAKRITTKVVAAIALFMSFYCGGIYPTAAAEHAPLFLQQVYSGDVSIEVMVPHGSTPMTSEKGSAEIQFSPDGQGHIVVTGLVLVKGEVALRLNYLLAHEADGSWRDDGLTISPDGQIEMLTLQEDATITGLGALDTHAMTLHLRKSRLDWKGADGDTELDLALTFDLTATDENARLRDQAGACATVVWQPRVMANVYGDWMSTVMVPVCSP